MKKYMRKTLLRCVVFFTLCIPATSFAESITQFDVRLEMRTDAAVDVTETITYDFGAGNNRHGIYRDIPTAYQTSNGAYHVHPTDISVTNEWGDPYSFSVSGGNPLDIKIGDPDIFVSGVKTYVIHYRVPQVINFLSNRDELYWNATGNDWNVPINATNVDIVLPFSQFDQNIRERDIAASCYRGSYGATNMCHGAVLARDSQTGNFMIAYENLAPLDARQGVTVAVGIPKGLIVEPTGWEKFVYALSANALNIIFVLLPILALGYVLVMWYKHGRDPKGRGTIIARYTSPEGLSPLEAGTIKDEKMDPQDIVAEVVYLAEQGHLKIHRLSKKVLGIFSSTDYELERIENPGHELKLFQKTLMEMLTITNVGDKVELSTLRTKTSVQIVRTKLENQIFESLVDGGYFKKNPKKIKNIFGILTTISFVALFFVIDSFGLSVSLSLGALILVFLLGGKILPAKTQKGVEAKEHMAGLKDYIETAEKYRLDFHNGPERDPQMFERILPFAIALKVEKKWARAFEDIYMEQPGWYSGGSYAAFSAASFAQDMGGFASFMSSTGTSSGGGASGGGGGGGGGGSW